MRKPDPAFTAAALSARLSKDWRLPAGAHLRVAYSGGIDSHVLLHALAAARPSHGYALSAIYIDHGLQPDSRAWGEHCARVCAALAVPFDAQRVAVTAIQRDGPEAAARRARYTALAARLASGEFLLTAHHRDDQAETVLLQLLRGSGVAGLAAMPERAPLGHGELLRPLLGFSRAALREYASAQRLEWIEDPSNQVLHLRRNFLRTEIVPRLEQHWPEARQSLARTAAHSAEAQALLDERAREDVDTCRSPDASRYPHALHAAAVARFSAARQRNLFRYWLRSQGFRPPDRQRLDELCRRVASESRSRQACVQWEGAEVWRYRDRLVAVPGQALPDTAMDVTWDLSAPLQLSGVGRLRAEPVHGHGLSRARLRASGVQVRMRHGGELLQLAGRAHRHAVKKLLQTAGVPPWERLRLPLFYAHDELVAVADRWVASAYEAQPDETAIRIIWEPFAKPEKIR